MGINPNQGDTPDTMQAFIDQTGVTFPVGWDLSQSKFRFNAPGAISPFPLDVIVDPNGTIVYVKPEYDAAPMEALIEDLL